MSNPNTSGKTSEEFENNSTTGRMLLNYILLRNNYPPLIILKKERKMYLDNLGKADEINLTEIKDNYNFIVNFVADEMTKSYWNIFL